MVAEPAIAQDVRVKHLMPRFSEPKLRGHLLHARWHEDADEPHASAVTGPHARMHPAVFALSKREVWGTITVP